MERETRKRRTVWKTFPHETEKVFRPGGILGREEQMKVELAGRII